jgi:hypothetical protein
MNYQRIYNNLISYRQSNPATGYTEKHHIVMKSMGGSNEASNLVVLTGREHWIAHLLLYKIHKNSQTVCACHMMAMRSEERGIDFIKNSRLYEEVRKQHASLISKHNSLSMSGTGNSQYGTCWISNIELQETKKIKGNEELPDGWIFGRNSWIKRAKKELKKKIKIDKKIKINLKKKDKNEISERLRNEKIDYFVNLYNEFCMSDSTSIRDFYRKSNFDFTLMSLIKRWKKHIPDYNTLVKAKKRFLPNTNNTISKGR